MWYNISVTILFFFFEAHKSGQKGGYYEDYCTETFDYVTCRCYVLAASCNDTRGGQETQTFQSQARGNGVH